MPVPRGQLLERAGQLARGGNVFNNCQGTDNATYARAAAYETNTSYSYGTKQTVEVSAGLSDEIQRRAGCRR
ncbi:hypothetical protein ACFWWT_46505 [Streptomyces sp. NPDC058676]|uniref:hypothetical protein n=1 Tax=unclassified Streptomyces TaxID=2593676 RepID=UPI003654204F